MTTIKRILKNSIKPIIFFTIILIIAMCITVPLVYKNYLNQTEKEALKSAEIAAASINKAGFFMLQNNASDLDNDFYKSTKESLTKTVSINKTIKAAYLLVLKNNNILVAVDSEMPGTKYYSPPGEVFDGINDLRLDRANGKPFVLAPMEYKGETWVTTVVPLYDSEGRIAAAYLNDYLATEWNKDAICHTVQVAFIVLLSYIAVATSLVIAALNRRLYLEKLRLEESSEELARRQQVIDKTSAEVTESEKRLSRLFFSVPTMMVMTSNTGIIYSANEAFLQAFYFKKEDILGKSLKKLGLFIDDSFCEGCIQKGMIQGNVRNQETVVKKSTGEYRDMLISLDKVFDESKNEFVISMVDITKRKRAEEVKRLIKKYRTIVAVSNTGGWEYDINSGGIFLSSQYFAILGQEMTGEEFSGDSTLEDNWINLLHPDDRQPAMNSFSDYIASHSDNLYENFFRMQHADGHWVWVLSRGKRLRKDDGTLSDIIVGTHIDVTEIKNKEEKIQYLNYHDQLTGVMNRRYYEEIVDKVVRPENLPLAVIMADVNGLKLTNDAFGHLSGDKLLTRVAEIIESEARPQDIVARLGGDEFIMLMPRSDSAYAAAVVKRINDSIQDYKIDNIVISVSFGWATKRDDGEDFSEVYKRAEYRMYRSKLAERSSKRSQSVKIIFKTLQEKSEQEKLHSERVSLLCRQLASVMQLPLNEINEVETAGLMHDIGKIGVDEQVLNKKEKFTDNDRRAMRKHSDIGYRILSSANEFNVIADYVLYHHERWDGMGYPKGLAGENIPLASRILAIADAYDAMVSDRCYKDTMTPLQAAVEIMKNAGTQFDPSIAPIFVEKILQIPLSDLDLS